MKNTITFTFIFCPVGFLMPRQKKIATDNRLATDLDKMVHKEVVAYMQDPARVGISIGVLKMVKVISIIMGQRK